MEEAPQEVDKKGVQRLLSKTQLLEIVQEEANRRVSKEFLATVEQDAATDGTKTILEMQEDVVASLGYPPEMVEVLRCARYWYPGVHEFWDVPAQVKGNIIRKCRLHIGHVAPNIELFNLEKEKRQAGAELGPAQFQLS